MVKYLLWYLKKTTNTLGGKKSIDWPLDIAQRAIISQCVDVAFRLSVTFSPVLTRQTKMLPHIQFKAHWGVCNFTLCHSVFPRDLTFTFTTRAVQAYRAQRMMGIWVPVVAVVPSSLRSALFGWKICRWNPSTMKSRHFCHRKPIIHPYFNHRTTEIKFGNTWVGVKLQSTSWIIQASFYPWKFG